MAYCLRNKDTQRPCITEDSLWLDPRDYTVNLELKKYVRPEAGKHTSDNVVVPFRL